MEPWLGAVLKSLNPLEEVIDWTDQSLPEEALAFVDGTMSKVPSSHYPRHRSNVIRIWLLNHFGGTWYDHDLIPLAPLDELPEVATASHRYSRCNCFLRFPVGHPFLGEMLNRIQKSGEVPSSVCLGELLVHEVASNYDIATLVLPLEVDGTPNTVAEPWAIHAYMTSSRER